MEFSPSENFWGEISLKKDFYDNFLVYISSKGFQSGGFNIDGTLDGD